MKKVKIDFIDFWEHWDKEDNFIINILRKNFEVEISENPDYIFFSNFGDKHLHMDYYDCVKIFYTQENLVPDFNFADYGIGFEEMIYGDRYCRFPIFFIEERYGNAWRKMETKHVLPDSEEEGVKKRGFCSFVVSNSNGSEIRKEMFEKLCAYKKVSSGGRYLNNIGMPDGVENKFEFQCNYKFALCFENGKHAGYCTEKLVEAFAARTVPIYWGDPNVSELFNTEAFVNIQDFNSLEDAVGIIKEIDQDDSRYFSMLKAPALKAGKEKIWEEKNRELEDFLIHIFAQEKSEAYRRNMTFWGNIYQDCYRKMRDANMDLNTKFLHRLVRRVYSIFRVKDPSI